MDVTAPPSEAVTASLDSTEIARLSRRGRYAEIMTLVRAAGVDTSLATMPKSTLIDIGNAARLSAAYGSAQQAYSAVRDRFPGSEEARHAAFALGRLCHDQLHTPAAAAAWFATYLREAPDAALACEAEGRLLEVLLLNGQRAEALTNARHYQQRCPHGPHASLARSLVEGPR